MIQKKIRAFTLMEVVVALLIVAILAVIAVPSYRSYITKGNRSDAIQTLLAVQLAEEKFRMTNTTYGDLTAVWSGVTGTDGGYYSLGISNLSGATYTITATAVGNQASDADGSTSCASLVLAYANGTTNKTPTACWME